ncbi:MAG: hypothetical protein IJD48_02910 [Clostridia bacterium]|nr:hypothetical protein [Clostridia bacterium]
MTVLEVLENASLYLNLQDEFKDIFEGKEDIDEETYLQFEKLLKCLNIVIDDICSQYQTLKTYEEVDVSADGFEIKKLSKKINQILHIKTPNELKLCFKIVDNKIVCDYVGKIFVEYSYYPEKLKKDDCLDYFNGTISTKTIALGVASEYCFVNGFFEDAKIWEQRFLNCINANLRKLGHSCMPKRRWF